MCINGMLMATHSLVLVVHNLRLMETSYVDAATGKLHPITFPVLVQVMHTPITFLPCACSGNAPPITFLPCVLVQVMHPPSPSFPVCSFR